MVDFFCSKIIFHYSELPMFFANCNSSSDTGDVDSSSDELIIFTICKAHFTKLRRSVRRSKAWWDEMQTCDEQQYKEVFRMSKPCLMHIATLYKNVLESTSLNTTQYYKETAMCIYAISRPISYRDIADKFGEATTTTFRIIQKVVGIFTTKILPSVIKLPTADEFEALAQGFLRRNYLYGTVLAIDGTHIPIEAPTVCPERYVNRKGWHSVSIQVTVDNYGKFRNLFGVFLGACHNAFVYRRSNMYNYVNNNLPRPYFIIGDAAYPGSDGLHIPYKGDLTDEQKDYNYIHSSQRMIVEQSLGWLKGRFKKFRYPAKNGERGFYVKQLYFACVIHNIILNYNTNHE